MRKVYAYITRGNELLVLRQVEFPEVGIQVPGGTPEPGEQLKAAAMREAEEETGLSALRFERHLADIEFTYQDGVTAARSFYHLSYSARTPRSWRHLEMTPFGGEHPIEFELYWLPLTDDGPALAAELDGALPQLRQFLTRADLGAETNA